MPLITIITPTFNRKDKINKLYSSLKLQTSFNFEWLIVDDGSSDNTKEWIYSLNEKNFKINYIYKINGGKHTALNVAYKNVKTLISIVVDSDDYLSNNAIELIEKYYNKYKNYDNMCGFCFLKQYTNGQLVTKSFPNDEIISDYNKYIVNSKFSGDKAEVFYANIIKQYKYPEYRNERFISEGYVYSEIARRYDMVFINIPIYYCEYLPDGLTKGGRKLRILNPLGGIKNAEEFLDNEFILSIRIKYAILYLIYSKFANKSLVKIIRMSKYNKLLLLVSLFPSLLIYLYWKKKYKV